MPPAEDVPLVIVAPATGVPAPTAEELEPPQTENDQDTKDARAAALEAARTTGVLGMIHAENAGSTLFPGGAFTSPMSGLGSGLGGVGSGLSGTGSGVGGLGLRGTGRGGGGTAKGLGTVGSMGTSRGGYAGGNGRGYGRGLSAQGTRVSFLQIAVSGSLDRSLVRRLLVKQRSNARRCYDQQGPTLDKSGRLSMSSSFIIDERGNVRNAQVVTSLQPHTDLELCLDRVIAGQWFPAPKSGRVNVRYDLVFQPAKPPPKINFRPPKVSGGYSANTVKRIMRHGRRQFGYCYKLALRKLPSFQPRVTTAFEIDSGGRTAALQTTVRPHGPKSFSSCVNVMLKTMRFPAPSAPAGQPAKPVKVVQEIGFKRGTTKGSASP